MMKNTFGYRYIPVIPFNGFTYPSFYNRHISICVKSHKLNSEIRAFCIFYLVIRNNSIYAIKMNLIIRSLINEIILCVFRDFYTCMGSFQ